MKISTFLRLPLLSAFLLSAAMVGCDDDGVDTVDPSDDPAFTLVFQEAGSSAATTTAAAIVGEPNQAVIGLDLVESIVLPVGEIEAQQAGGGWVEVGSLDTSVDLLDLPEEGEVVLEGNLPEGSYTGLRLFLTDEPTITLADDVTVGRTTFEAGTHTLVIPSSQQSGVKLNAAFEVDEDGQTLTVLHDSEGSVSKVTATGSGVLKISPVLTVRDEDGQVVGELDDPEVEADVEFEGVLDTLDEDVLTLDDGTVVVVGAETEIDGDILTLEDVAAILVGGETIRVEGEGVLDTDESTILATTIRFEVE